VGQKILVVEDNELNLKLFCDLLRAHGFEAEPVRDGREAVGARPRLRARPDRHGHPDAATSAGSS
jgi:two-component system cell cycle response regulator DivK